MLKALLKRLTNRSHNAEAFYCNALQGQSTYNICINCDMTVSCNCQDYDGSGHIGDLRANTFEEIFRGGKAQQFREALARREFPVPQCKHCPELRSAPAKEMNKYLTGFDLPRKAIMVENTILCNLKCLYCDRTKTQKIRSQNRMSVANMEQVALLLQEHGIEAISFHNLGEPFVSDTFHAEIETLIRYNPDLQIYLSTNGALIDTDAKINAALMLEHLYFSIDGPNQGIMSKYQVGGDFEKSYTNMKRVVAERDRQGKAKPTVEWKYVVFNWNDQDDDINKAIELARNAGVDLISFMHGGAPFQSQSKRYTDTVFFQNLGEPSWRGREIWFR